MLREIIAVAQSTFIRCLSAAGRLVKRLLRPASATVMADGDFARFPGLRWENPLAG